MIFQYRIIQRRRVFSCPEKRQKRKVSLDESATGCLGACGVARTPRRNLADFVPDDSFALLAGTFRSLKRPFPVVLLLHRPQLVKFLFCFLEFFLQLTEHLFDEVHVTRAFLLLSHIFQSARIGFYGCLEPGAVQKKLILHLLHEDLLHANGLSDRLVGRTRWTVRQWKGDSSSSSVTWPVGWWTLVFFGGFVRVQLDQSSVVIDVVTGGHAGYGRATVLGLRLRTETPLFTHGQLNVQSEIFKLFISNFTLFLFVF